MQVKLVDVESGLEIRTTGIVWTEGQTLIINTKPSRFTFSNVTFRGVSEITGTLVVELQGTTQMVSGTGDVPKLYHITLQHGF